MTLRDLQNRPGYKYAVDKPELLDEPQPESPNDFGINPPSTISALNTSEEIEAASVRMIEALRSFSRNTTPRLDTPTDRCTKRDSEQI